MTGNFFNSRERNLNPFKLSFYANSGMHIGDVQNRNINIKILVIDHVLTIKSLVILLVLKFTSSLF